MVSLATPVLSDSAVAGSNSNSSPEQRPQDAPDPPRETAPAQTPSQASIREMFLESNVNATFAIRPFEEGLDQSRRGLDERLILRAMRLLLESPACPSSQSSAAEKRSRSGSNTPRSSTQAEKPHSVRLARLQGQAMAGIRYDHAEGTLASTLSEVVALRASRRLGATNSALEAESLLLCYLDGLRHGNPGNSALAAGATKLTAGLSREGPQASASLRQRAVFFAVDRWHSAFFNTPHTLTGRAVPQDATAAALIASLGDMSRAPMGTAPAEVLRASLVFGTLTDMAQDQGGWKYVSLADCDSAIHSVGAAEDWDSVEASTPERPTTAGSVESRDSDRLPEAHIYSVQAFRSALRGVIRLWYRFQTLPSSTALTIKEAVTLLEAFEDAMLYGTARAAPDPKTLLLRTFIGHHVFALAACTISWLSRALALLAKVELLKEDTSDAREREAATSLASFNAAKADATTITHLWRRTQDFARMIGPLCLFSSGKGAEVRPLYLRIASFNHSTVSYMAALDDVGQAGSQDLGQQNPLQDKLATLQAEIDGRASLAQELGPLGLVLASTTNKEGWALIQD